MNELYVPVPGWEDRYEISDHGNVRSYPTKRKGKGDCVRCCAGRIRKLKTDKDGYRAVDLWRDGKGFTRKVHHLVLLAFGHERPEGAVVRHLNADRADNRLSNLQWGTILENHDDRRKHGWYLRDRN